MSTDQPSQPRRSMFVDFMYAIVVGSALPLLNGEHLAINDLRLWSMLFLMLVILEDYYLYETKIVPFQTTGKVSLTALFFELSILISWYLSMSAVSSKQNRIQWFLYTYGLFFLLKFLAGVAHWMSVDRSLWKGLLRSIKTNHAFVLSLLAAFILAVRQDAKPLSGGVLIILVVAWLFTLVMWWRANRT